MPVSKKKITAKPQESIWPTDNKERLGTPKGFWPQLALALVASYSLYAAVMRFSAINYTVISINPYILLDPGTSSLLIVIFSILYFFAVAKRKKIPKFVRVCSYIIITIALLVLALTFLINSKNTSSSDLNFTFFILFHNFFVSGVLSAASLLGITGFIVHMVSFRRPRRK